MPLPQTVKVKLSSEAAEAISLTPVLLQELPLRELVEHMLGVVGKDEPRIREILLRGTLVSGASRFRWPGWDADVDALRELLATFPDADPSRAFAAEQCVRVVLRGGRQPIEITRESGTKKGMFQRECFWDVLMRVITAAPPAYGAYSYRHRADRFVRELSLAESETIRAGCDGLKFSSLRDLIRSVAFGVADLYVNR